MSREFNPIARNAKKTTRKRAIAAFCACCRGCEVEHTEPGFRDLIRNCTATGCPLFKWRPYQLAAAQSPQVKHPEILPEYLRERLAIREAETSRAMDFGRAAKE